MTRFSAFARTADCSHVIARICVLVLSVVLSSRVTGAQAFDYSHTTFLNGFASSDAIWHKTYVDLANTTPPDYLSRTIYLKTKRYANVNANLTWSGQVNAFYSVIGDNSLFTSGRDVIVAHSLGGMVARGLYIDSVKTRPGFGGIITLATPHQGTILADSIYKARNFLLDVQRRVNDGVDALRIVIPLVAIYGVTISVVTGTDGVLGPTFAVLAAYGEMKTAGQTLNLGDIAQLAGVPALPDLRTDSPAVQHLNANVQDASLSRATIVGSISSRNAAFRIRQSLKNDDAGFADAVRQRDDAIKYFRYCKVAGYAMVLTSTKARRCSYAAQALSRVDDRWLRYVNGTETQTRPLPFGGGFIQVQVARVVPFDGIVSNERSNYPGLTDGTLKIVVPDVNHQNIYSTRGGLDQVSVTMGRFGMIRVPPTSSLAVTIAGPTALEQGSSGTWTANASGGAPPYTYLWSGILSGTRSSISGSGAGTLRVDVMDAVGSQVAAQITVRETVTTSCGTKKVC